MTRFVEGTTEGTGLHIGIAVADWNRNITDRLLEAAVERCEEVEVEEVTVVRVPGALELPLAARALAEAGCDAVVTLGAVVKGETDHYEIVVRESSGGVARVALDTGVPVTNGILAVHDYQQALERSGPGEVNKGVEAVDSAILTATALNRLVRDADAV
ncbi:MAG: 6,7-dimethyl-8-ribityllumazine synthase [Acidimicrobiia bacterium]